jgi:vancomycin resistance protein YoaR
LKKILPLLLALSCAVEPENISVPTEVSSFSLKQPETKIIEDESKILFVLSSFETKYKYEGEFKSRASNIERAIELLNGTILKPNEEFSFNETVGERTEETGFKEAPIYFEGVKTDGMGGGVCQVSSTLYATAMLGHLRVTQRTSHSRPSSYIPRGLDATVSYPELDLKLVNPYKNELEIIATAESGILRIYLLGKERDFDVKYIFRIKKFVPYKRRVIVRSYQKREPFIYQKGREGSPGYTVWVYKYTEHIEKSVVASKYEPVDEVWYSGPDDVASVEIDEDQNPQREPDSTSEP